MGYRQRLWVREWRIRNVQNFRSAARGSAGATERRAKSERVSVVDGQVVDGVLAPVGVVVASQQTIELGVDEHVVAQTADSRFRHARWPSASGTADGPLALTARVRFQTGHAESVAADQDLGTNPEAVVAQSTSQELLGHGLRVIFTAVVRLRHVRIRHRRHIVFLGHSVYRFIIFITSYQSKLLCARPFKTMFHIIQQIA